MYLLQVRGVSPFYGAPFMNFKTTRTNGTILSGEIVLVGNDHTFLVQRPAINKNIETKTNHKCDIFVT